MTEETYTGGCQCGAVRFHVRGVLKDISICHCRMCQKAFGNFFAPLVNTKGTEFEWTRGEPKTFQSSNVVTRGFCGNCGTPLYYDAPDGLAIAVGAFDHPEQLRPVVQFGVEAKIAYCDELPSLPTRVTEDDLEAAPFLTDLISYQHPDHDTDQWPEAKS
ncbi:GFA family protein [Rhizobium sp. L1K21]|uniref:GFA family protein n=1 Tax=Rhizobium sp. L1K21 TaxID=2954933 RepID=UPI002092459B|nr:GFA family protein [Rhizobium sp. L1K21]MCO6186566.1 GFA family protein [Rhizobium sp. L1K21]